MKSWSSVLKKGKVKRVVLKCFLHYNVSAVITAFPPDSLSQLSHAFELSSHFRNYQTTICGAEGCNFPSPSPKMLQGWLLAMQPLERKETQWCSRDFKGECWLVSVVWSWTARFVRIPFNTWLQWSTRPSNWPWYTDMFSSIINRALESSCIVRAVKLVL